MLAKDRVEDNQKEERKAKETKEAKAPKIIPMARFVFPARVHRSVAAGEKVSVKMCARMGAYIAARSVEATTEQFTTKRPLQGQ